MTKTIKKIEVYVAKSEGQSTSIALRIATLMQQMNIDSLPRNYELIYEAYSGANPELASAFAAIGKVKSQKALDELGRKFLPHHHEGNHLSSTNERIRGQMSLFMNLIQEEKNSLAEFGKAVADASSTLAADGEFDREAISKSIGNLAQSAAQQAQRNQSLAARAETQSAAINEIKSDMDALERTKFIDPLTGLGNRRAFNRAMIRIYANPELPMLCGLAFADVDNVRRFNVAGETPFSNQAIIEVAKHLQAANGSGDFVARLDGSRFAFLFNSGDSGEIMRIVEDARSLVGAKDVVNPASGRNFGPITLSLGVAMSEIAKSPADLVTFAESAMAASQGAGGNKVTLFAQTQPQNLPKDWMLYKE